MFILFLLLPLLPCAASDVTIHRFGDFESAERPKNILEYYGPAFLKGDPVPYHPILNAHFERVGNYSFSSTAKNIENGWLAVNREDVPRNGLIICSGAFNYKDAATVQQYTILQKIHSDDESGRTRSVHIAPLFAALTHIMEQHNLKTAECLGMSYKYRYHLRPQGTLYLYGKRPYIDDLLTLFPNIMPHGELDIADIAAQL